MQYICVIKMLNIKSPCNSETYPKGSRRENLMVEVRHLESYQHELTTWS